MKLASRRRDDSEIPLLCDGHRRCSWPVGILRADQQNVAQVKSDALDYQQRFEVIGKSSSRAAGLDHDPDHVRNECRILTLASSSEIAAYLAGSSECRRMLF